MNTSRDIEKLFDHFGGNAGEYQEIGRENEARSARTRWPLLATLDFAQPAIPEIAPRREAQLNTARPVSTDTPAGNADKPTPIHRGKQQLFTRPHRRTIPAVNPPAAESLSALRFSAMGDSASSEGGTIPDSPDSAAARVTPVQAPVAAVERKPEPARPVAAFGSTFLARRPLAKPAAPAPHPHPHPAPAASQSILGKLFKPQAQHAASAPADSLHAIFERLRHADHHADEPTNPHAARAGRLSRS
jgi:hypothetical protein